MQRGSRKGYLRCTRCQPEAIFGSRAPRKRAAEELEREFPVESGISGGDVPSCYTNLAKLQDRRVEVPPNACAEKLLIDLGVIEFRRQFWSADPILTAVYDNCLPGDECCIVTGKKQDRTGYVPGLSEPLDGLLFPGGTLLLFRLRPDCLGICQTGQNRICCDSVAGNIIGQTSHEPMIPILVAMCSCQVWPTPPCLTRFRRSGPTCFVTSSEKPCAVGPISFTVPVEARGWSRSPSLRVLTAPRRSPARSPGQPRLPGQASLRVSLSAFSFDGLGQLVEKQINGGKPAVAGNDEISPCVSRRLTRAT